MSALRQRVRAFAPFPSSRGSRDRQGIRNQGFRRCNAAALDGGNHQNRDFRAAVKTTVTAGFGGPPMSSNPPFQPLPTAFQPFQQGCASSNPYNPPAGWNTPGGWNHARAFATSQGNFWRFRPDRSSKGAASGSRSPVRGSIIWRDFFGLPNLVWLRRPAMTCMPLRRFVGENDFKRISNHFDKLENSTYFRCLYETMRNRQRFARTNEAF